MLKYEISVTYNTLLFHFYVTPWGRVLLEKLTGPQLVKKFSTLYGTRRFITALTTARHLPLLCARPIKFIPPPPAVSLLENLI